MAQRTRPTAAALKAANDRARSAEQSALAATTIAVRLEKERDEARQRATIKEAEAGAAQAQLHKASASMDLIFPSGARFSYRDQK